MLEVVGATQGAVPIGVIDTVFVDAAPLPHVLIGVTCIVPPDVVKETVMLFVLAPFIMVTPAGTDHEYSVPEILGIE